MTNGSLAGGYRVEVPLLPAEATTTILLNHRISTAASIGSMLYDWYTLLLSDRFTTLILYVVLLVFTHCKPFTTSEAREPPWSSLTFTFMILALGAMPM